MSKQLDKVIINGQEHVLSNIDVKPINKQERCPNEKNVLYIEYEGELLPKEISLDKIMDYACNKSSMFRREVIDGMWQDVGTVEFTESPHTIFAGTEFENIEISGITGIGYTDDQIRGTLINDGDIYIQFWAPRVLENDPLHYLIIDLNNYDTGSQVEFIYQD